MTIFRAQHDKNNPYTIVNKTIASDSRLSWKAKGIWLYAFSRPDNWIFYLKDLVNQSSDGRDSVNAGLKELEQTGYLHRSQSRNDDGKFEKGIWNFFETPKTKEEIQKMFPKTENPLTENPLTENPLTENRPLLNKEYTNHSSKEEFKEEQQQEEVEPDGSPVVVSFHKCLKIVDMTDNLKRKLTEMFPDEQQVMNAIEAMKISPTPVDNPFGWLVDCIKGGWVMRKPTEMKQEENAELLKKLRRYDGQTIKEMYVCVGKDYIEFSKGAALKTFNIDSPKFQNDISKYLEKLGVYINQEK